MIHKQAFLKLALIVAVQSSVCFGQYDPPSNYYTSAENLTGNDLRSALHEIINDHDTVAYANSDEALMVLNEDPANTNNVILIYSRISAPKTDFGVYAYEWNREHLWANSYGIDSIQPAYSDLHNLRPCNVSINSTRSNKIYDYSDISDSKYKNPAHTNAPLTSSDSDSWEPPDVVKGDIARSLFYMDVRYEGTSGEPDLILTDNIGAINTATNFMGRLGTLIKWHQLDPVDDAERLRNDQIFDLFQNNRNPFVDHPEWVQAVFVPRINIHPSGTVVRIGWNSTELDIGLISSESLTNSWTVVTNAPAMDENGWHVDLPVDSTNRFFRLQAPE